CVRIWHEVNGIWREKTTLRGYAEGVFSLVFDSQGRYLATGSKDHWVKIWERVDEDFSLENTLSGHTQCVFSLAFEPHGLMLATESSDRQIKIWPVRQG
ncbi:MAG TPA: hypothetical protein PLM00_02515, partial [Spirochaetota bacterium]|nr:hypothetical protein [Spirochaetota bacterium]